MSIALASRKSRALLMLCLSEMLLLMLAVLFAAWLRFVGNPEGFAIFFESAPARAVVFAAMITVSMVAFGLYQVHVRHSRMEFFVRLVFSFAFGGIALLVLYYLVPRTYIGRGVLALALVIGFIGVAMVRVVHRTRVQDRCVQAPGAGVRRRPQRRPHQQPPSPAFRPAFVCRGGIPAGSRPTPGRAG